jgi:UDP-N-acetyl-D-mannosaminuronic acid transferase (WecB/TagA/CpsF family)
MANQEAALKAADFLIPDGAGVVLASKILGAGSVNGLQAAMCSGG